MKTTSYPILLLCLALAAAAAALLQSTSAASVPHQPAVLPPMDAAGSINCQSLSETLDRPRWLTLPMSRLVVNPTWSYSDHPSLVQTDARSLDLAYYVGEKPVRLPRFWQWSQADESAVPGPDLLLSQPGWTLARMQADFAGGQAHLSSTSNYGSIEKQVTMNLDQASNLVITVPECTGAWALKVNDGSLAVDIPLISDTSTTGQFAADIPAKTGWHGIKKFTIRLFVIGGPGKSVIISHLQFYSLPGFQPAHNSPTRITWQPHQLISQWNSENSSLQAECATILLDKSAVSQRLRVRKAGSSHLRLTGQFSAGAIHWDETHHALLLQGSGFHAVLTLSRPAHFLGVRASMLDWLTGQGKSDVTSGAWALSLDGIKPGEQVIVTARFTPTPGRIQPDASAAPESITASHFTTALRRQEAIWNRWLQAVPHPLDFTPRAVDPLGACR